MRQGSDRRARAGFGFDAFPLGCAAGLLAARGPPLEDASALVVVLGGELVLCESEQPAARTAKTRIQGAARTARRR
jgi:hypothetical protein